jgi:uncharacterized protein (UPF0276 family)
MFQSSAAREPWQEAPYRFAATAPAPLGVGVLFTPALRSFVRHHLGAIDFVSIVPEEFWPDTDPMGIERTTSIHAALRVLDGVAADRPLIAHGTGLVIGGQAPLDRRHLARIAEWQSRYGFRWYSEHLVLAADVSGCARRASMAPLPYDRHALKRVVERVREIQALLPIPFLLENNIYAEGVPQQEMSEPMFLNRLCAATGCGIVLDIHNLYANAITCGIDALSFLDRVDLTRVVEIHVGTGPRVVPAAGFFPATLYPPSMLEVLEAVLWRAPKLRAVTIEVDADAADGAANEDVLRTIEAARRVWKLYH